LVGTDYVYGNAPPGIAYVFLRSGGAWTQYDELTPATGASGDIYGYAVAMSANTLLVGSPNNSSIGAAYVYSVVSDTTPPVIAPTLTPAPNGFGWNHTDVSLSWSVTDPESGIASSTGCGAVLLTAETAGQTITCSATNAAGLSSSQSVTVKLDKTPPVISGMPGAGCSLWPPNHKLVQVAVVTAADALSGLVPGSLHVTGTSNEPIDPSDPAIVITPNGSGGFIVQILADRLGDGSGRIYTLTATANDYAGNTATVTATCVVPHDQGK
jgi:hypothetical protein